LLVGSNRRCFKDGTLLQLSYIGRALPVGNDGVAGASNRKHFEALTTEFTTESRILDYARGVSRAWADRYLSRVPFGPFNFVPGAGACLEGKRSEGGNGAALIRTSADTHGYKYLTEVPPNVQGRMTLCRNAEIKDLMFERIDFESLP